MKKIVWASYYAAENYQIEGVLRPAKYNSVDSSNLSTVSPLVRSSFSI